MNILLIDNYDSYTFNLYQLLYSSNNIASVTVFRNDFNFNAILNNFNYHNFNAIVLSPGPGSPHVKKDLGICSELLAISTLPILAVCLGHQGLALAYNGNVVPAIRPMHGETSCILHNNSTLFRNIPSGFRAVRYHSLVVSHLDFPSDSLDITAWTDDNTIMAMQHKHYPIFSTQFHPESICTQYGREIIQNFIDFAFEYHNTRQLSENFSLKSANQASINDENDHVHDGKASKFSIDDDQYSDESTLLNDASDDIYSQPFQNQTAYRKIPCDSNFQEQMSQISVIPKPLTPKDPETKSSQEYSVFVKLHINENSSNCLETTNKNTSTCSNFPDPQLVFQELFASKKNCFWLDSAKVEKGLSRFSYMGCGSGPLSHILKYSLATKTISKTILNQCNQSESTTTCQTTDGFFGHLAQVMNKYKVPESRTKFFSSPENNFDYRNFSNSSTITTTTTTTTSKNEGLLFTGGLVGYLGYEMRQESLQTKQNVQSGKNSVHHNDNHDLNNKKKLVDQENLLNNHTFCSNDNDAPDSMFLFADRVVIFDHELEKVHLSVIHDGTPETTLSQMDWISETQNTIRQLLLLVNNDDDDICENDYTTSNVENVECNKQEEPLVKTSNERESSKKSCLKLKLRDSEERYKEAIKEAISLINKGETYEVCLTTQLYVRKKNLFSSLKGSISGDKLNFEFYKNLRKRNPAPNAAFLQFGQVCIASSSPERFMQLGFDGSITMKPIKGTMEKATIHSLTKKQESLGENTRDILISQQMVDKENARRIHLLGNSPHFAAENLMIVDLIRNDLNLICDPPSVCVPSLFQVETFETVYQLVTTVNGTLRSELGAIDAMKHTFPPGSMTGAPKRRTVDLLHTRLEGEKPRGVYSGTLGFFSVNGTCDFSVVIRTVFITPNQISVGAGGAVIRSSDPDAEFKEMLAKANSVLPSIKEVFNLDFEAS